MTQAQLLMDLGTILVQFVFIVSTLFVVGISFIWPWWESDLGGTIVLEAAAIAVILLRAVLHYWFGLSVLGYWWSWIGVVAFAFTGITILWRGIAIFTTQRYAPPLSKAERNAWRMKNREDTPEP